MTKVYLSGAISNAPDYGQEWREFAKEQFSEYVEPSDPLDFHNFEVDEVDQVSDADLVRQDKLEIADSDIVLVNWQSYADERQVEERISDGTCQKCGETFTHLSKHWNMSGCGYPNVSMKDIEAMQGLVMGDATIGNRDRTPRMDISMVSGGFLDYLYDRFGPLSSKLTLKNTAGEQARKHRESGFNPTADHSDYSDVYRYQTRSHLAFEHFKGWYGPNGKRFPKDLELSPEIARFWYVSDGGLNWNKKANNAYVQISAASQSNRDEDFEDMFGRIGFEPNVNRGTIQFGVGETDEFLDYIGEPLPNFEYKWENKSKAGYVAKKPERQIRKVGTPMEIIYAYNLGIPVYVWHSDCVREDLSPWVRHHASFMAERLEDVVKEVERHGN